MLQIVFPPDGNTGLYIPDRPHVTRLNYQAITPSMAGGTLVPRDVDRPSTGSWYTGTGQRFHTDGT
jgi:hypothetical protein